MIWKRSVRGRFGSCVASPKTHGSSPRYEYVRERFDCASAGGLEIPPARSSPMRVSNTRTLFEGSANAGILITQRAVFLAPVPVEVRSVVNGCGDDESGRSSTGDGMY